MGNKEVTYFWSNVNRAADDECWLWQGARQPKGYGVMQTPDGVRGAHRFSYLLAHPDVVLTRNDVVRHTCDNPPCVNPAHLRCGTYAENSQDMVEKGRSRHGEAHYLASLTEEQVKAIAAQHAAGKTRGAIAREFGVTRECVKRIVNGITWGHVTGIPRQHLDAPVEAKCLRCGQPIIMRTLHAKQYCSAYCQQAAWKTRTRGEPQARKCGQCGAEFKTTDLRKRFCQKLCGVRNYTARMTAKNRAARTQAQEAE